MTNAHSLPVANPGVTIKSIPPEIIMHIFKYVYMAHRISKMSPGHFFLVNHRKIDSDDENDVYESMSRARSRRSGKTNGEVGLSTTLFPFALAYVCKQWRDIVTSEPRFWGHIVILVDTQCTPVDVVEAKFHKSRNRPIQVIVTRRPGSFDEEDPLEKERVDTVMTHLAPRLHHCRTLRFNVLRRSSLPHFCQYFRGEAPRLTMLIIQCQVHDGGEDVGVQPEWLFSFRALTDLVLDGRSFRDACRSRVDWLAQSPTLESITISHFRPTRPSDTFSLHRFLEVLTHAPRLTCLDIVDIEFDDDLPMPITLRFTASTLTFTDLRGSALAKLLQANRSHPEALDVTRCSFDGVDFLPGYYLDLTSIDPEWDLRVPFEHCSAGILAIFSSSGFNDDLLAFMTIQHAQGTFVAAPFMAELSINDCTAFSPEMLVKMVKTRREAGRRAMRAMGVHWDGRNHTMPSMDYVDGCRPLHSLSVSGGPELSEEHRQWFIDNVPGFDWSTTSSEAVSK
ncbi:hypothetical protein BV22DRAFT_1037124 [Leucogyrophana mollusca]|uniref:Uncharacterized protein n=1 Tax=Leucogyrophana mollusca TaxID=85980 RepID=A0ACB8BBX6_9AGAM|nr:hypothetical protein BV22DRAFT_1037124 [Leucogyrophana mollusca]